MHKVEKSFAISKLVNDKGVLEYLISFESKEDAEKWLDENAIPKIHYVITEVYRRQ